MQRLRSTWMAIMAGALLVTLSVSAAFGAGPPAEAGDRGQSIASFVHQLVFGNDQADEPAQDELTEEDELIDDESDLDEEGDEPSDDELDDEDGETASAHGECVAEEASDKSDEVDEGRNHGAVVSEAARETCWETDESDEDTEEPTEDEGEDEDEDEEAGSHGACVSDAAQDRDGSAESELKNHGKWVSQHARYTCWGLDVPDENGEEADGSEEDAASTASDDDDQQAAKADRGRGKPSWAGTGNGHGNSRGGGRR